MESLQTNCKEMLVCTYPCPTSEMDICLVKYTEYQGYGFKFAAALKCLSVTPTRCYSKEQNQDKDKNTDFGLIGVEKFSPLRHLT